MIRINIQEAKTHLSRYLARLAKGESIVLCNRNVAIAEIRPLPRQRTTERPIGLGRDSFTVPPSFFEPLPEEELKLFGGEAG